MVDQVMLFREMIILMMIGVLMLILIFTRLLLSHKWLTRLTNVSVAVYATYVIFFFVRNT